MQQAHRTSTLARLSQDFLPRVSALSTRRVVATIALALLVGVAVAALALGGPLSRGGHRAAPALGAAPAPDYTSDLGTDYDPFVIANSQRRYVSLAPAPDYTSDLGTDYDPFVIANSRPRYAGSGQGASGDGGPCHTLERTCNR